MAFFFFYDIIIPMNEMTIYMDHAATTKPLEKVIEAVSNAQRNFYFNPSSAYLNASLSKRVLDEARANVSNLINCTPSDVYFTSGGTESDNMAIRGILKVSETDNPHIITSEIEHPAILETLRDLELEGVRVTYVPVSRDGIVSVEAVENAITDDTVLISIMYANNETGVLQPIEEIGRIAHSHGIVMHTDAVQAFGQVEIDVEKQNIDLLTASSHKIYGPKGVGILYKRGNISFAPMILGGGQQENLRSGTENVDAIAGFGVALNEAYNDFDKRRCFLSELRSHIEASLLEKLEGIRINGANAKRIDSIISLSISGIEAEALLMLLDMKGICISAGSACSSKSGKPSHVLSAMRLSSEDIKGTVRISPGIDNTMKEADFLIESIVEAVNSLRKVNL